MTPSDNRRTKSPIQQAPWKRHARDGRAQADQLGVVEFKVAVVFDVAMLIELLLDWR